MNIPTDFKDRLRERVVLSDIVRKKVPLTRKGTHFLGLCPFHKEKSPSFKVDDHSGLYYCFGCKATGDAIKFVMETEGLSFADTIAELASGCGMELPKPERHDIEKEKKTASLHEVLKLAADWYHRQLFTRQGKEALHYLQGRRISAEAIEQFTLGYAPEKRGSLLEALKEHGATEGILLEAGLLGTGERGEHYERFRNRLMFPIYDSKKRVIAFGGRILGSGQPKYLNSPETSIFKKSDVLYGEHIAQKAAFISESVIVVEGYMDVIAMHMAGFTHSVAPLGTAVTDLHLLRLWRLAKTPVFCLDGDTAGLTAMQRVAEHSLPLLKPEYSVHFAMLPKGIDPDDLLKSQGKEAMQRVLAMALPLSEMLWNKETAGKSITTPDDKASLEMRLMKHAETIADKTIRAYYQKYFRNKLWQVDKQAYQPGKKGKNEQKGKEEQPVSPAVTLLPASDSKEQFQQILLALIIHYPELLEDHAIHDALLRIDFIKPSLAVLRLHLLTVFEQKTEGDSQIPLEKSAHAHDIEYLCGENSLFKATIHHGFTSDAKSLWKYFLNQYNLTLIQTEWKAALHEMTESSMTRASAYQSQIVTLEEEIRELYQVLQQDDE